MAFETLEDIIRALEQHPEWRRPLLKALEIDRLLELPDQFAEWRAESDQRFARLESALAQLLEIANQTLAIARETLEIQRGMLAMMQQLKERQDHYEERLDRFEERMARMEERQEQFDKRQQEFAERQDQFDKRQQEFAERQEQFDKRQQEFAERQDQFDKRQGSFEKQLAKMQDDIASLKGTVLELKYKDRAPSIFGRYLRKVKPVAIDDLLETLEAIKPLTDKELDELLQADFIFSAVKASTREPIYVVMEISYVVDRGDVLRAIQRAQVLKDRGIPAIPAVAGEQATKGAKRYAERGEVLLALNGVIRGMTNLNPPA